MKYLQKSFTSGANTNAYRDNFDAVFGKPGAGSDETSCVNQCLKYVHGHPDPCPEGTCIARMSPEDPPNKTPVVEREVDPREDVTPIDNPHRITQRAPAPPREDEDDLTSPPVPGI